MARMGRLGKGEGGGVSRRPQMPSVHLKGMCFDIAPCSVSGETVLLTGRGGEAGAEGGRSGRAADSRPKRVLAKASLARTDWKGPERRSKGGPRWRRHTLPAGDAARARRKRRGAGQAYGVGARGIEGG